MVSTIIKAAAVFEVFLFCKPTIDEFGDLLNLVIMRSCMSLLSVFAERKLLFDRRFYATK